jgi:hypothetical protein
MLGREPSDLKVTVYRRVNKVYVLHISKSMRFFSASDDLTYTTRGNAKESLTRIVTVTSYWLLPDFC